MKISQLRHSRAGFTLLELIIAMSIFMLMSSMAFLIYFNISETSRRLQISREISESARQVTEYLASEIRSKWVVTEPKNTFSSSTPHEAWKHDFASSYKDNWSEVLPLDPEEGDSKKAKKFVVYGKKDKNDSLSSCTSQDKEDVAMHCGIYVVETKENGQKDIYNLIDVFRSEEDRKRVKVKNAKFYISASEGDATKVTLKMTLQLMPKEWVPASLVQNTTMEIQTTFSERPYKIE